MGKTKVTKKFASMKRLIDPKDQRLYLSSIHESYMKYFVFNSKKDKEKQEKDKKRKDLLLKSHPNELNIIEVYYQYIIYPAT